MSHLTRASGTALGALILLLSGAAVALAQPDTPMQQDHAALAQSYAQQAAELREQAASHRRQAQRHRTSYGKSDIAHFSMAKHCDRLAKSLSAAAKEADKLAELHRKLVPGQN